MADRTSIRSSNQADQATGSSIAMLGDGFYSNVSLGPKAVIDKSLDLVLRALAELDLNAERQAPLVLADFGAADGGTSLDLINAAVDWVRSRYSQLPISLYYTDLPGADFATLFNMMNGDVIDRQSPVKTHADVHAYCTGLSFYKPLLPRGTLDLGFSASAMHYLSVMPGIIQNHIHAVGASPEEDALFKSVALNDWETILLKRSHELATGGRLIMANFCVDDAGRYLGNTGGVNMFDTYNELWAGMRDDGVISRLEYTQTAFQQYYKSLRDTLAPFQQETSPVYQSGLVLERFETAIVECPFRLAFERGDLAVAEFASQFVNTHRSWTETTFRAGLSVERPAQQIEEILDELYARYRQTVIDAPTGHGKDLLHVYLTATKQQVSSRL